METRIFNIRAGKTRDGKTIYLSNYKGKRARMPKRVIFGAAIGILAVVVSLFVAVVPTKEDGVEIIAETPTITTPPPVVKASAVVVEPEPTPASVDEELVEMLALVIYQEAGADACSDETRRMVGEVAMNRVADSRFPDTLEEVLLQKQQYGMLYWTGLVWPERASTEAEAHAVERAHEIARIVLSGEDELLPDDVIFQAEFRQGTETIAESDGIYFCR